MQIVLHVGAHVTDEDQLISVLVKNAELLQQSGVLVPEPGQYRPVIREALQTLNREIPPPQMQEALMTAICHGQTGQRLILSHDAFMGVPIQSVAQNQFYPMAGGKVPRLQSLFDSAHLEIFLAICNPATFLPGTYNKSRAAGFDDFLDGSDPLSLRWSELILRLQQALPGARMVVWANEDTPMTWLRILQAMVGTAEPVELDGAYDFLGTLMGTGGLNRMQSYLRDHPPMNERQRQRIIAAFLEKFAKDDVMETEVELPGWTEALVQQLTESYDSDLAYIATLPGVTFVEP